MNIETIENFEREKRIALRLLSEPCIGKRDKCHSENCGPCELRSTHRGQGPNYSGWARIYVQAGRTIPKIIAKAFIKELESDNKAYANALKADIAYYGLTIQ